MLFLKKNNSKSLFLVLIGIFSFGFISFMSTPSVFAVAKTTTWTGTDCNVVDPAVPECNWSNINNWDLGVPVDGDSLVFPASLVSVNSQSDPHPLNDILNLSIETLTISGDGGGDRSLIELLQPLIINQEIVTTGSARTVDDFYGSIILGNDVTISTDIPMYFGKYVPGDTVDLAGHTLTFTNTVESGNTIWISSNISGNGSVIYDYSGFVRLNSVNSYSGTTHIRNGLVISPQDERAETMFGSSGVYITNYVGNDKTAPLVIGVTESVVINNHITIEGPAEGFPLRSIAFSSAAGNIITMPNLELMSPTDFINRSTDNTTIDIDDIILNNNCLGYATEDMSGDVNTDPTYTDGLSLGFINGPTDCVLVFAQGATDTKVETITAPNTAIQRFITTNPIIVAVLGVISVISVMLFAHRQVSKK